MIGRARGSRAGGRPWHLLLIAAAAIALVVLGIIELGSPASSARVSKEVVTAENGVVQTTVSGTGNVEPGVDEDVNFATGGTLNSVDVKVGQHVTKGELLATLDPSSAELTLDQADASLTAAEDQLTAAEDGGSGDSSNDGSGNSSGNSGGSSGDSGNSGGSSGNSGSRGDSGSHGGSGSHSSSGDDSNADDSSADDASDTASQAASVASAEAQVDSAEANVKSDEQTVDETKLYAPVSGTIASLSDATIGESISAGSGSSGTGAGGSSNAADDETSTTDDSSGSSDTFAQIIGSKTMTMTVSLSESDISSVHVGQVATVSIDALSGVELGAHVTSISPLGSDQSGVVSYDATLTIYQHNSKVLPGMSATATIITDQARGVTVPNQAITGAGSSAYVRLERNGKAVLDPVVVGLRGSSRSQIVSGLKAGQQLLVTITLPALGTSTSTSSSTSGTLGSGSFGSRFGGAGGGGFGGGAVLRALNGGGGATP